MHDVAERADIELIVKNFYDQMLGDPIIGFIFTDVAKIHLESHLPIIADFWYDLILKESNVAKSYSGNALAKHLQLSEKIPLRAGHFTRWLYLFFKSIDASFQGPNADKMKDRAEQVAKSISAAITAQKRGDQNLVLGR